MKVIEPLGAVEVDRDLVGADVLGDAAGLFLADVGLADGVQQSGLAVVDVAHHGDHRWPGLEVLLAALVLAVGEVEGLQQLTVLVLGGNDLHDVVHLAAEKFEGLVADGLRRGDHLTEVEQRLYQRGRVGVDLLGEVDSTMRRGPAGWSRRCRAATARRRRPAPACSRTRRVSPASTCDHAWARRRDDRRRLRLRRAARADRRHRDDRDNRRRPAGAPPPRAGATAAATAVVTAAATAAGAAGTTAGACAGTAATGPGRAPPAWTRAAGTASGPARSARTRRHIARRHAGPRRTGTRCAGGAPAGAESAGRPAAATRTGCCRRAASARRAWVPGRAGPGAGLRAGRAAARRPRAVAGAAAAAPAGAAAAAGRRGAGAVDGRRRLGRRGFAGAVAAALAGWPLPSALTLSAAGLAPPNDSRSLRATGASTVEDADLTNSPCSLSRARTSLLVTPSSLANSCTRALPATTSPSLEATAVVGAAPRVSYDAWSSGLHGVLMFFATCSVAG